MKLFLPLFLLSCLAFGSPAYAILGGARVQADEEISRYTAFITMSTPTGAEEHCSGTLIDSQYILTAAHCVVGLTVDQIRFFDGSTATTLPPFIHPAYKAGQYDWDAAIIPLASAVELPGATLVGWDFSLAAKSEVWLAGYGMTVEQLGDKSIGRLNKIKLPLRNYEASESQAEIAEGIQQGACHVDSGGPAFVEENGRWRLWGIDSHGGALSTGCGTQEFYTKVSAILPWINAVRSIPLFYPASWK